jgi:MFS transporter, PPP family, 3-phenylpropionic acid transporter
LSDYFGLGSLAYVFLSYGAITLLICLVLPDAPAASKSVLLKNLNRFFSEPKTVWFFLFILITAIPHRMNDMFLGVYIQAAGGTPGLVGQAWFYAAVSDVVFFAISFRFLRRGNEIKLISFAAVLYCLRYFACSLAPHPRWIVYLQLLQGCTFVVFYTAAIQYLYAIVPEEWRSTGQTMLAVLFFGVSGIIGSFLGGWIFDTYGDCPCI